jgi:pimeloyl-ACP methyl ester carboxylesterase
MNTNDLLHRWATLSLNQIEDQIVRGEDMDTVTQLLGADQVNEIRSVSFAAPNTGPREDVVLLPGIMGSLLASIRGVTTLTWINPLLFLEGNARYLRLGPDGNDECGDVETMPISLEKLTYLKIGLALNRQSYLHEFPYDWRRPIEYNADCLHASLERWAGGDPTRKFTLVAHSMGGLVSRAYMARHPEAAEQRIKALIMHGTPNFGATNAIDTLVNGNSMMATADRLNDQNNMRQLVYCLPGVYQLLPAPQQFFPAALDYPVSFDLYNAAAWDLPVIQQKYLDMAHALHQALAASDPQVPMTVIAGCNISTLVSTGLEAAAAGPNLLPVQVEKGDHSGDGTVPLWSSQLPGARLYYIQEVHAKLPANGQVIQATLDLIQQGTCSLPDTVPAYKFFPLGTGVPVSFDGQVEDLRGKIQSGSASQQDLEKLFFAF